VAKQVAIDEACADLVATDAEKFRQLAEELTYSEETYESKLQTIKESYFSTKPAKQESVQTEEFMTDAPVEVTQIQESAIDPVMARYVAALERH
jgi:hypothetical protein